MKNKRSLTCADPSTGGGGAERKKGVGEGEEEDLSFLGNGTAEPLTKSKR